MRVKLGTALNYEQPTKYIVESEKYNDTYKIPVLTAGKSFILGYTDEENGIYDNLPVIIFDDFTTEIKFVDFPFKVKSSAMKMLQPSSEAYNLKYFYYLIKYLNFQPTSHQRHWISKFAEFEFDIPDRQKQNEIVEKLDKLCEMTNLKQEELKKYDELVKSQFIEMFKNCEETNLCKIAKITMGQSPSSESYNDNGIGIAFFQGKADFGDKYTVVKHYTNSPTKLAEKDDILISVRAPVGPVNIANENCCIGRGLASIRAIHGISTTEFLYSMLKSKEEEIAKKGTGSTFKAINKDVLYSLKVPNADSNLQNKFADFVKHIDKLKFYEKNTTFFENLCYNIIKNMHFTVKKR